MNETSYARDDLLVDTGWLAAHSSDPGVRVVDAGAARGEAPRPERIAGAVSPPHYYIKSADDPLHAVASAEAKAVFEAMGISDDTLVVAYDSAGSRNAARLWWVLAVNGHDNVRLLNGGFEKWSEEGRPLVTATGAPPLGNFTPRPNPAVLSTADSLLAAIDEPNAVIWDTRAEAEYTGEDDRGNARVGHVPGAVHIEWSRLMAADATFKPASEMRSMLEAAGITPDKAVHVY